jgi:hypothetical protein
MAETVPEIMDTTVVSTLFFFGLLFSDEDGGNIVLQNND